MSESLYDFQPCEWLKKIPNLRYREAEAAQLVTRLFIVSCKSPSSGDDLLPRFGIFSSQLDWLQRNAKIVVWVFFHLVLQHHHREVASALLLEEVCDRDEELASLMVSSACFQVSEMGDTVGWFDTPVKLVEAMLG